MLLKELIIKGTETISSLYPEREAKEMVYAFLEHHLGTKRHTHIIEPMYEVADDLAEEALSVFRRMASGEPLQYVTGFADFYGRKFHVTPDVLIPRPETEILCHNVLAEGMGCQGPSEHLATIPSVLDLCTGSGCIAWTLALEMPGADVTAVDISDGALAVASSQDFAEEIARTGAHAPKFIKADVLAGPSAAGIAGQYDILVSNPPYVMDKEKALMRANVLEHEPHLALFVSDDDPLIFYRAIADWALAVLKPGGYCIVEINEALGPETAAIYEAAGFTEVRIVKDLSDRDRFVSFRR
jgi:release factor glutamine methyltransferase